MCVLACTGICLHVCMLCVCMCLCTGECVVCVCLSEKEEPCIQLQT